MSALPLRAGPLALALWLLMGTASVGCEGVLPEPDFERMQWQRGYRRMRPPSTTSVSPVTKSPRSRR